MPSEMHTAPSHLLDAAVDASKNRDFVQAIELWHKAGDSATADNARQIADGVSAFCGIVRIQAAEHLSATESLLRRAIDLREKHLPANDYSTAIEYNNLGMYFTAKGDESTAVEYLEKAVEILNTRPLDKENYADPYDNLALLLSNRKEFKRALELCQKALEIRDNTLGKINPLSVSQLDLMADILESIKPHSRDAREARKEFKARLVLLAAECDKQGDTILSQALFVATHYSDRNDKELISSALTIASANFVQRTRY
jgi:tetratricopeptide (TPR) repeat protein